MIRPPLVVVIIFSSILFAYATTPAPEWITDFDRAKGIAGKENKFILINFSGSDWCAPCIKLKKEVFENEEFFSVANEKLVLVHADFPRSKKNKLSKDQAQRNEALAEVYNPGGKFPYTLLLDADGKVLRKWDGYLPADGNLFIEEVKIAVITNGL